MPMELRIGKNEGFICTLSTSVSFVSADTSQNFFSVLAVTV